MVFSDVIEMWSKEIGGYVRRVIFMIEFFFEKFYMSWEFIEIIWYLVVFYDVGKISIFEIILYKLGKFDLEEWEIMKIYV